MANEISLQERRMSELNTIGVVGAGVMGQGLAQDLAQHGFQVLLIDVDEKTLAAAKKSVRLSLRAQLMLERKPGAPNTDEVLANIETSTDMEVLRAADFVIENVTEKWDVKKDVWRTLDRVAAEHAVFAANTSAISITRFGSLMSRPQQVLGMHFMNPVPMKRMVEVIRGFHTSERTLDTARRL